MIIDPKCRDNPESLFSILILARTVSRENNQMEASSKGSLQGLIEVSMVELPVALQKWMFGVGGDSREVEDAVLKACQAWTNLANQGMERVFQAEGFVGLMTGSVKQVVQYQRIARE